jgi:hypothetical protein
MWRPLADMCIFRRSKASIDSKRRSLENWLFGLTVLDLQDLHCILYSSPSCLGIALIRESCRKVLEDFTALPELAQTYLALYYNVKEI